MIKIKEFAGLCQCSTQTLRYYDQVGLLSPAYVDDENSYRYYERNQLYDYIKIKNLQLADFSITEIKGLLKSSDEDIYHAFDQKINVADYPVLQGIHDWNYLHEIMADLCAIKNAADIIYYLEVTPDKLDLAFTLPTILLQTVLRQNPEKSLQLECQVRTSPDDSNHVYILDKQGRS